MAKNGLQSTINGTIWWTPPKSIYSLYSSLKISLDNAMISKNYPPTIPKLSQNDKKTEKFMISFKMRQKIMYEKLPNKSKIY